MNYRNPARASLVCIAALTLVGATSCTEGDTSSAPAPPDGFCWGIFAGSDVRNLLPNGEATTADVTQPFDFSSGISSTTCTVSVDGNTSFQAVAQLENTRELLNDSIRITDRPNPFEVAIEGAGGEKGWVWDRGAISYIKCKPFMNEEARDVNRGAKFVLLRISAIRMPDIEKGRAAMPSILQKYTHFAAEEIRCEDQ